MRTGSSAVVISLALLWSASAVGVPKLRFPAEDPQGALFAGPVYHVDHDPAKGLLPVFCFNYRGDGFPGCYDGHRGTDYLLAGGFATMDAHDVRVVAAAAGVVTRAVDGNYDRCHFELDLSFEPSCDGHPVKANEVEITHADGSRARYLHLKKGSVKVAAGQSVTCGQLLGYVGSSGISMAPHLHFEVLDSAGKVVDPYSGKHNPIASLWVSQHGPHGLPGATCAGEQTISPDSGPAADSAVIEIPPPDAGVPPAADLSAPPRGDEVASKVAPDETAGGCSVDPSDGDRAPASLLPLLLCLVLRRRPS